VIDQVVGREVAEFTATIFVDRPLGTMHLRDDEEKMVRKETLTISRTSFRVVPPGVSFFCSPCPGGILLLTASSNLLEKSAGSSQASMTYNYLINK
jgi:hypothetical protein